MKGLSEQQVEQSRKDNGSNALTQVERDPIWKQLLEGLKDPMIMILGVAFLIQIIFCFMGRAEWFEPVGIFVAIVIATLVGVLSENSQESKAAALRAEALAKEKVKVYRDGKLVEISINDVVVGDIVSLQAGDKIPADGVILNGTIKVDQAALNGESEEAKKIALESDEAIDEYIKGNEIGKDLMSEVYLYRGTVVCHGECEMRVLVVGDKSTYGKLALEMQEDTRDTPLKVKLNKLAGMISKFGYIGATAIALVFMFRELTTAGGVPVDFIGWLTLIIDAVSLGVVIVCMAVPEGLPMMISMVLAMNMGKMMKDNVLVHKLNGIETAGSLNILFSDKTGTITKGQLSVVEVATVKNDDEDCVLKYSSLSDMTMVQKNDFIIGVGVNNSATISDENVIGGNSTDRALMKFLYDADISEIDKSEVYEFNAFDSTKKCSSVTIDREGTKTVYFKGAAEKIIARCTHFADSNGVIRVLNENKLAELQEYQDEQASRSMRILAVAKGDNIDSEELVLLSLVCIRDDVRPEAITAIEEVNQAGVQVVMVTGDRYETAIAIAKEAGLYRDDSDDVALTSAQLNEMGDDEVKKILKNLKVVARALPTDKSRLVRLAQELDEVVGMTGDGVLKRPVTQECVA